MRFFRVFYMRLLKLVVRGGWVWSLIERFERGKSVREKVDLELELEVVGWIIRHHFKLMFVVRYLFSEKVSDRKMKGKWVRSRWWMRCKEGVEDLFFLGFLQFAIFNDYFDKLQGRSWIREFCFEEYLWSIHELASINEQVCENLANSFRVVDDLNRNSWVVVEWEGNIASVFDGHFLYSL